MKYCPILLASSWNTTIEKTHENINISAIASNSECGANACVWYGKGCPAFPTQADIPPEGRVIDREPKNLPHLDTFNKFMVAVLAGTDSIFFYGRPLPESISKKDALNLAAWLVALATSDPDNDFMPLLKAVQDS